MEYMEVSLDSLDLRVKGILSSPAAGQWVLPDHRALWGPRPGNGGFVLPVTVGVPAAPWRLWGPDWPQSDRDPW